ncbi:hypothetical protein [Sinomonas sp.]|jgi:hypothetical protein|uniref:hypothetical protein n=1 Tax=Sinomonas sp. TaxID=1914986 RepID=UPI002FE3180F
MPWWFWVLLWAVLLLGTAVATVSAGFWLVRKALRFLRDGASSFAEVLSVSPTVEADGAADLADATRGAPGRAVFAHPDDARRAYEEGRLARRAARRERRIARRRQRGQAQSLRDLGLI